MKEKVNDSSLFIPCKNLQAMLAMEIPVTKVFLPHIYGSGHRTPQKNLNSVAVTSMHDLKHCNQTEN